MITRYTSPVEAEDVTDEMIGLVRDVVDGWYQDSPIDWEDVWDRVDGAELADGTRLDLGSDMLTPALRRLRREARRPRDA